VFIEFNKSIYILLKLSDNGESSFTAIAQTIASMCSKSNRKARSISQPESNPTDPVTHMSPRLSAIMAVPTDDNGSASGRGGSGVKAVLSALQVQNAHLRAEVEGLKSELIKLRQQFGVT